MNEKIRFNYFYNLFKDYFDKITFNILHDKIGVGVYDYNYARLYYSAPLSYEERIAIFDKVLLLVCREYRKLTNSNIEILDNPFENLKLILDKMEDNPYKESFLSSFGFICRDYLECLGKGSPLIWKNIDEEKEPTFFIILNSEYQINDFYAVNMEPVEEAKTMLRILTLEKNKQIGPIPNVTYRYRKDI